MGKDLLSGEHFSVDGTLIQAWAGHKSFFPKDSGDAGGSGECESGKADITDFHGEKRSNATHYSSPDADARRYCKGDNSSRLRYMGHTLCDNRHGLITNAMVTTADGFAEREAAKVMIKAAMVCNPCVFVCTDY